MGCNGGATEGFGIENDSTWFMLLGLSLLVGVKQRKTVQRGPWVQLPESVCRGQTQAWG